jgi:hypothetical protein
MRRASSARAHASSLSQQLSAEPFPMAATRLAS